MKVDLYMDIYDGIELKYLSATAMPCKKSEGVRRLRITVNVPDHFIYGQVDGTAVVEETKEVDKDEKGGGDEKRPDVTDVH